MTQRVSHNFTSKQSTSRHLLNWSLAFWVWEEAGVLSCLFLLVQVVLGLHQNSSITENNEMHSDSQPLSENPTLERTWHISFSCFPEALLQSRQMWLLLCCAEVNVYYACGFVFERDIYISFALLPCTHACPLHLPVKTHTCQVLVTLWYLWEKWDF